MANSKEIIKDKQVPPLKRGGAAQEKEKLEGRRGISIDALKERKQICCGFNFYRLNPNKYRMNEADKPVYFASSALFKPLKLSESPLTQRVECTKFREVKV